MEKRFTIFYPGVYTEREKPLLDLFLSEIREIEQRGPVPMEDIRAGRVTDKTPGVYTQIITDEMIRYNALKYDPFNPVYNDESYAVKLGYKSLPGLPTIAAHDDSFMRPFPREGAVLCDQDEDVP